MYLYLVRVHCTSTQYYVHSTSYTYKVRVHIVLVHSTFCTMEEFRHMCTSIWYACRKRCAHEWCVVVSEILVCTCAHTLERSMPSQCATWCESQERARARARAREHAGTRRRNTAARERSQTLLLVIERTRHTHAHVPMYYVHIHSTYEVGTVYYCTCTCTATSYSYSYTYGTCTGHPIHTVQVLIALAIVELYPPKANDVGKGI